MKSGFKGIGQSGKGRNIFTKSQPQPELDEDENFHIIPDDEINIHHTIPESNIKITNQLGLKTQPDEEPSTVLKGSPARDLKGKPPLQGRSVNIKPTPSQERLTLSQPQNDPEVLKKLIYSVSPKQAAQEYIQSARYKDLPKSVKKAAAEPSRPSERHFPYGFNNPAILANVNSNKENDVAAGVEYESAYTELAKKLYMQRMHQTGGVRNTHVAKATNYELLLSPKIAREIENRRNYASKEFQDSISQRLLRSGEILGEHTKALVEAYINKELEECTFQPYLIQQNENRRDLNKFLEDQNNFVVNIGLKRDKIKSKLDEQQKQTEGSYKPELCKKSVQILEKKKKAGIPQESPHQRLYKVSKNAQQKQMQEIAENEDLNDKESNVSSQFIGNISRLSGHSAALNEKEVTFVPKIHKKSQKLKREQNIDNILYSDAIRRQKKPVDTGPKSKEKEQESSKKMSEASRKAFGSRFIREFDLAIMDFLASDKDSKLDYNQINIFLHRLVFLKDSENIELPHFTPERTLLHDMWTSLHGDENKGVHRRNLLVFLLAVMGLSYQITKIHPDAEAHGEQAQHESGSQEKELGQIEEEKVKESQDPSKATSKNQIISKPSSKLDVDAGALNKSIDHPDKSVEGSKIVPQRETKPIGTFDSDGNYELTPEDVKKIRQNYSIWFVNRMNSRDNIGQMTTSKRFEEHPYHPDINQYSRNIAHLHREKILESTTELIHANKIPAPKDGKLTHADLLMYSKRVGKEKVDQRKLDIQNEELKGCTFRPVVNDPVQTSRILGKSATRSQLEETSGPDSSKDRCLELYSLRKSRLDKSDRDPHDIEYEKNCDECTFQPDLSITKLQTFNTGSANIMAKNIEKTIERLRSAQAVREQKTIQSQRGFNPTLQEENFKFGLDRTDMSGNLDISKQGKKGHTSRVQEQKSQYGNRSQRFASDGQGESSRFAGTQDYYQGASEEGEDGYGSSERKVGDQVGAHDGDDEPADDEKVPLLFVDVNLGQGKTERIVVYEGDKSETLSQRFAQEHGLDENMTVKLKELLDSQIAGLLTRIDEELNSLQSENDKVSQHGGMEGYRVDEQIREADEEDSRREST